MPGPVRFAVSAMPGVLGRIYERDQFFDAIEAARRARTANFEGLLYAIFDDDTVHEFDMAGKVFGPAIPWPF